MLFNTIRDPFFDDFFAPVFEDGAPAHHGPGPMRCDIREVGNDYELSIEMPGVRKEDVKAELKDGYLNISISRADEQKEGGEDGRYLRRERFVGSCTRSFKVGDIDPASIKGSYRDGILYLVFPNAQKAQPISHSILIE